MVDKKQLVIELIVSRKNKAKQRFQYFVRSDRTGYWKVTSEWTGNSWQKVNQKPITNLKIDTPDNSTTPLVECPVCGRVGLPERIIQHDCETNV